MPFRIAADHAALPGHFPGRPVVPGVLVLERVIEAAEAHAGLLPGALRLPQVKFLAPLLPDEAATICLEPRAAGRLRFRVLRGATPIAQGELAWEAGA
ncbi:hypothetical protein [Coralloluteibacterium stylophorae]|uniref:ApeI dehydratase-like domain-containing protein n=1 Tax=Coralloluteibacterium stylophorae TaxID=1776034 RepID=A0A8J7VSU8_9GAMM|nr:hypothetical protein [Coralloluteibacterium stylophorae]